MFEDDMKEKALEAIKDVPEEKKDLLIRGLFGLVIHDDALTKEPLQDKVLGKAMVHVLICAVGNVLGRKEE